jgi:type I restriction-modification system DNA methylase subunit/predicted type IV restriction endonuclease
MAAPTAVTNLVDTFHRNRDAYRAASYNETQLRREFLDPFFMALGWDVNNTAGYAEAYKDVIHEDSLKIGAATKAPDYCFRIGGARKFFLEAKKPAIDIAHDIHPAFQLRRYAWSAKLPLSVLSDFEELAVYDTRVKPVKTDKASAARTFYFTYDQYRERWDEIASIFSRDAVLKGSFDKYVESAKRKKGTAEVDAAFLAEIETWRDALARNLALRNPALSNRQLNFAVQRTIDRLIFLRIAEDRGIEPYAQLQALQNGAKIYPRLLTLYDRADERYNSGLFYFHPEKDRPDAPDELTPALTIDDKILKDIIKNLYYPDSPYEFAVLPADILGQVYEQFLGKVISLTAAHRAKVEDKPEVKKAGGVYYTPTYIVDYIVQNTLGRLLHNENQPGAPSASAGVDSSSKPPVATGGSSSTTRNPKITPQKVAKIKILDPACGSGSFLIGAYQYLLDWHIKYYSHNDPQKWAKQRNPRIYQDTSKPVAASSEQRELGDVDYQNPPGGSHRVREVDGELHNPPGGTAKRVCELGGGEHQNPPGGTDKRVCELGGGELQYTPTYKLTTAERKRILLNNIFGVDIDPQAVEVTKLSLLLKVLEGESAHSLDNQLKLFHERALPDLSSNIKCGNSLIGPDFYDHRQMELFDEDERLKINAFDWHAEFPDIFKGKNPGFDAVIGNPPYVILGKEIYDQTIINYLHNYSVAHYKVDLFHLFIERGVHLLRNNGLFGFITPNPWLTLKFAEPLREYILKNTIISEIVVFDHLVFTTADVHTCLLFLDKGNYKKDHYVNIKSVTKTMNVNDIINSHNNVVPQNSWIKNEEFRFETRLIGEIGNLVTKLMVNNPSLSMVARASLGCQAYNRTKHTTEQISKRVFHAKNKISDEYLPELSGSDVGRYLIERKRGQWIKYGPWLHDYRSLDWLQGPRILIREISGSTPYQILACYVEDMYCNYKTILNVNPSSETNFSMKYLLGILNSKLLSFLYPYMSNKMVTSSFPRLSVGDIKKLPVYSTDFSDPTDRERHDCMVQLVRRMLDLHKSLAAAQTPNEKTALQRQIKTTDQQIDKLVYELYDLTKDEIKIIEDSTNK